MPSSGFLIFSNEKPTRTPRCWQSLSGISRRRGMIPETQRDCFILYEWRLKSWPTLT
jgi:hypothetical protein